MVKGIIPDLSLIHILLNGVDGRLVHHIGQVRAHSSGGGQGDLFKVHRLIQPHVLGMDLQDIHTALQIRLIHNDTAVKPARS